MWKATIDTGHYYASARGFLKEMDAIEWVDIQGFIDDDGELGQYVDIEEYEDDAEAAEIEHEKDQQILLDLRMDK